MNSCEQHEVLWTRPSLRVMDMVYSRERHVCQTQKNRGKGEKKNTVAETRHGLSCKFWRASSVFLVKGFSFMYHHIQLTAEKETKVRRGICPTAEPGHVYECSYRSRIMIPV